MRNLTTLLIAAVVAATSSTTFAGGLSPEIMETPAPVEDVMAPAASSISPTYIVLGLLAALLIAAAVADDDDDDDVVAVAKAPRG